MFFFFVMSPGHLFAHKYSALIGLEYPKFIALHLIFKHLDPFASKNVINVHLQNIYL
jgi:hypothetical protein